MVPKVSGYPEAQNVESGFFVFLWIGEISEFRQKCNVFENGGFPRTKKSKNPLPKF